jgi:hypothetical protein
MRECCSRRKSLHAENPLNARKESIKEICQILSVKKTREILHSAAEGFGPVVVLFLVSYSLIWADAVPIG